MYRIVGDYLLYRRHDNHQEEVRIHGWVPAAHPANAANVGGLIVAMGEHGLAVTAYPWDLEIYDDKGVRLLRYRAGTPLKE